MRKKKGQPPVEVIEHALIRFHERWPECVHMSRGEVVRRVREQIEARERDGDVVEAPGGLYYPISFLGRDGYAVLKDNRVKTLLPEEYCPEVNSIRAGSSKW